MYTAPSCQNCVSVYCVCVCACQKVKRAVVLEYMCIYRALFCGVGSLVGRLFIAWFVGWLVCVFDMYVPWMMKEPSLRIQWFGNYWKL